MASLIFSFLQAALKDWNTLTHHHNFTVYTECLYLRRMTLLLNKNTLKMTSKPQSALHGLTMVAWAEDNPYLIEIFEKH